MPRDPFLDQSQDRGGTAMPSLKAGQWLFNRRYELKHQLGAGGMGVVWLAWDHTEEIEVALKFLPTLLVLQDTEMKRLREEVRAGKGLRHPRLVATYGMEIEDGIAAIVMEYVAGKTLKEMLEAQERGFFEPEEITGWAKDVCDALGYLHDEAKRIHRDLKPANVMIDEEGRAKLMDFGISHRIKEGVSRHSKTNEGQAGGSSSTLAYASPQQLAGKPSSKADDIYSLGATLYELLTGTPPFFRGSMDVVAHQIKNEEVTPILERRQELVDEGLNRSLGAPLPDTLSQVILACLAKERERRLPDAATVWQKLSTASEQQRMEEERRHAEEQKHAEEGRLAEARRQAALNQQRKDEERRLAEERKRAKAEQERIATERAKARTQPVVDEAPSNRMPLLWACFMALLASGTGFALRGGLFDNWAVDGGLTSKQLTNIGAFGFSGFVFGILIGGLVCDKVGYARLVFFVFKLHLLSALVSIGLIGPSGPFEALRWGMFLFAMANGVLEAVANPLVSTLFPENRTRYLNHIHAGWMAGMVIGTVLGWVLDDAWAVSWRVQLALSLVPVLIYGFVFYLCQFPQPPVAVQRVGWGGRLRDVGMSGGLVVCGLLVLFFGDFLRSLPAHSVANARIIGGVLAGGLLVTVGLVTSFSRGSLILLALYVAHALLGTVELASDGWIQNITGSMLMHQPGLTKALFLWTSAIIIAMRLGVPWIDARWKPSPVVILLASAIFCCLGLGLATVVEASVVLVLALSFFAIGKSLLWPTMLAIVGDRYPRSGAVAMSVMGAIGMLSAGVLGGPAFGYFKDHNAGEALKDASPALFAEFRADSPSYFLDIPATETSGLNGSKVADARATSEKTASQTAILQADLQGDRMVLRIDALLALAMAAIYLALMLHFRRTGGYKALDLPADGPR